MLPSFIYRAHAAYAAKAVFPDRYGTINANRQEHTHKK
jgi:hypothetical protein